MGIKAIEKMYEWGVYIWQKPDGHLFHDGNGNFLSIQAYKGDLEAVAKLAKAAAYYGQPEGKAWWHAGGRQVSDTQYSEQISRLKEGLIPSMDDLGAVYDAQQGIKEHGSD